MEVLFPVYLIVVAFCIIMVSLGFRTKKDLIETNEMDALRILSISIISLWTILFFLYVLLKVFRMREFSITDMLVSSLVLTPLTFGFCSYARIDSIYARKYESELLPDNESWKHITEIIEEISSEFKITKPEVRISKHLGKPVIYGNKANSCTLLFPSNFPEMVDSAVSSSESIAEIRYLLNRYVIAHELAHIKHRDAMIKSIMSVIIDYTKFFLIPISAVVIIMPVVYARTGMPLEFSVFLLFLFLISYGVFFFCYMLTLRHSENLADARAQMICDIKPENSIVIKYLFENMKIQDRIKAKKKNSRWISIIPRFHSNRDRIKVLLKGKFFSENRTSVMVWTAILMGIWLAVSFAICLVVLCFIKKVPFMSDGRILIGDMISENGQVVLLIILIHACITTVFFVLPIRNSIYHARSNVLHSMIQLGVKDVIAFLAHFLVYIVIGTWIAIYLTLGNNSSRIISELMDSGFIVMLFVSFIYAMAFVFSIAVATQVKASEIVLKYVRSATGIAVTIGLYSIFIPTILVLLYLNFTVLRLTSIGFAMLIGYLIIPLLLNTKMHVSQSHCIFWIYGRPIIKLDFLKRKWYSKLGGFLSGILYGLVQFVIPMLLVLFPLEWVLRKYSETHKAEILVAEGSFAICALYLIYIMFLKRGDIKHMYYEIRATKELFGEIDKKVSSRSLELMNKLKEKSGGYQGFWHPFLKETASMENTHAVILISWDILGSINQEALNWILKQECEGGGYTAVDGVTLIPQLSATYYAIDALNEINQKGLIKYTDRHIGFILSHQTETGGFANNLTPTLAETYHAIATLKMLGAKNMVISNRQICAEWIFLEWVCNEQKNKLNFEETYYLVFCLQWLDDFNDKKKDAIIENWLPRHRLEMMQMRPDTNYEKVYYYIKLLDLLNLREADIALKNIKILLTESRE